MALPTSGNLSLSAIQTEFGGSDPIGINEYYAGGAYVAAGTSGTNGAVPSSGQISFSQFYGTSAALVNLTNFTATGRNNGGRIVLDGQAGLNGANVNYTVSGADADRYTWLLAGTVNDYQIKATLNSGSISSGTTGSWLNCNTNPQWSISASIYQSANLTWEIRTISDSVVQDSCTVTMNIVA